MALKLTSPRQKMGADGEDAALAHLLRAGLTLIERNYRVRGGEIDLVCRDGRAIVFVEVRLRNGAASAYGNAAESIGSGKQARLIRAARHWLTVHGDKPCRFDCVLLDNGRIEWLKNAFFAG